MTASHSGGVQNSERMSPAPSLTSHASGVWPRSASSSTTRDPRNPDEPVTSTFTGLPPEQTCSITLRPALAAAGPLAAHVFGGFVDGTGGELSGHPAAGGHPCRVVAGDVVARASRMHTVPRRIGIEAR